MEYNYYDLMFMRDAVVIVHVGIITAQLILKVPRMAQKRKLLVILVHFIHMSVLLSEVVTLSSSPESTLTPTLHAPRCAVNHDILAASCRALKLRNVPQYLPKSLRSLDISFNQLGILLPNYWRRYTQLLHLNISTAGVHSLWKTSFVGLDNLQSLDLTNNPVLAYLHSEAFISLKNLQKLYISGEVTRDDALSGLDNLEELTLTFKDDLPSQLSKLTKLKVLTLAFSLLRRPGGTITADLFSHLSNSSIEELTFHNSQVYSIAYGAFDAFTNLKLLNLACNKHLQMMNVLDVLSSMKRNTVQNLILDGTQNVFNVLGMDEAQSCKSVWKSIKNLSIRNTNMYGFNVNFIRKCLDNLESIAVGFNYPVFFNMHGAPAFYGGSEALQWLFLYLPKNLEALDAESLLQNDPDRADILSSCHKEQSWIPNNWDWFPKRVPRLDADRLLDIKRGKPWVVNNEACSFATLPNNLTYLGLQNLGDPIGIFKDTCHSCSVVQRNSLRHLNMSRSQLIGSRKYYGSIYGLDELETLDLSFNELVLFNFSDLVNFPSLKTLILQGNLLKYIREPVLDTHAKLQILDLSYNKLISLPSDIFRGLTSLATLNVRGNLLKSINFIEGNLHTLSHLDIGKNNLTMLTDENIIMFDNLFSGERKFLLDMAENPFLCNCQAEHFIRWIHLTDVNIKDKSFLTCHDTDESWQFLTDIDLSAARQRCFDMD